MHDAREDREELGDETRAAPAAGGGPGDAAEGSGADPAGGRHGQPTGASEFFGDLVAAAFARQVATIRRQALALRRRLAAATPTTAVPADVRGDTVDDLLAAIEELQVAEQELLQQHQELAQARLALEQQRARYEELFAFAPDAYIVTRPDGQILEANRAASELLKVPEESLVQKPLPLYVAAEDRGSFRTLLQELRERDRVDDWTLHVAARDGRTIPVAATAAAVRDGDGGPVLSVRWLLHNVTEREQAQEALRRANAELEARISERTRELAERTTEAEAASQGKSELLATMSHELRTPINAIMGYTQLLDLGLAGSVTEPQREYLARLTASAEHLLALVNDVLDLAKVEAGRMQVVRERATTTRVVEAALALTLPQAEVKGVRLVDAGAAGPAVAYVGDEGRVRQIVINLLSNAVKFTPTGGTVTIECSTAHDAPSGARLSGGGPWAFIRVSDTGIGIAPEHHAAVFEPFMQVEGDERGPYRRTQGGTGLGLTISRRLARLMGGDLTLESEPGRGSTFTLWLPATDEGEDASERGARALREASGYRVRGLAEVGDYLREHVHEVLEAVGTRLRSDPSLPRATELRRSELEDHQLAFLADLAQWLVAIDETGGLASELLRDGSTIQRVVAELHGRTRFRQSWTEEQIAREYAILGEELDALVRRYVPEGAGDVSAAAEVLRRLVGRATATARRALRHAGQEGAA